MEALSTTTQQNLTNNGRLWSGNLPSRSTVQNNSLPPSSQRSATRVISSQPLFEPRTLVVFHCHLCEKEFSTASDLQRHFKKRDHSSLVGEVNPDHHKVKSALVCSDCKMQYDAITRLAVHFLSRHGKLLIREEVDIVVEQDFRTSETRNVMQNSDTVARQDVDRDEKKVRDGSSKHKRQDSTESEAEKQPVRKRQRAG